MPPFTADDEYLFRNFGNLRQNADVEGAALVSADGHILVSSLVDFVEANRVASVSAMLAVAASLGANLIGAAKHQTLEQVYFKGQHGYVIIMPLPNETVLAVLAREQAKLG